MCVVVVEKGEFFLCGRYGDIFAKKSRKLLQKRIKYGKI